MDQNILEKYYLPNLVSKIRVVIQKNISCIVHARTKAVKNLKFGLSYLVVNIRV